MDRFRSSLVATTAVFFWLPVFVVLIIAGIFPGIGYSFGLIFLLLGTISSVGSIFVLNDVRHQSTGWWYYGLPLAIVLGIGTVCSAITVITVPGIFPGESLVLLINASGISALLFLAPFTLLFSISLRSIKKLHDKAINTTVVSGFVSILSLVMLIDMASTAVGVVSQQIFRHPFWEGMMILYGMGTVVIGISILIMARASSKESLL